MRAVNEVMVSWDRMSALQMHHRIVPSMIVKRIDPAPFCGGASELDAFLSQLHQKFRSHSESFPNEYTKIGYACRFLRTWAEHPKKELRTSHAIDPINWCSQYRTPEGLRFDTFSELKWQFAGVLSSDVLPTSAKICRHNRSWCTRSGTIRSVI